MNTIRTYGYNRQMLPFLISRSVKSQSLIQFLMLNAGILLICMGLHEQTYAQDFNDERVQEAFADLLDYLEGSFGALVMVIAGIFAIVSAAFGQYRAALGCLVIGVGSFILRSFISTFFNIDVDIADGNQ